MTGTITELYDPEMKEAILRVLDSDMENDLAFAQIDAMVSLGTEIAAEIAEKDLPLVKRYRTPQTRYPVKERGRLFNRLAAKGIIEVVD